VAFLDFQKKRKILILELWQRNEKGREMRKDRGRRGREWGKGEEGTGEGRGVKGKGESGRGVWVFASVKIKSWDVNNGDTVFSLSTAEMVWNSV